MKWITNTHKSEVNKVRARLTASCNYKRTIVEGNPKPGAYTTAELNAGGMVGLYELYPDVCDDCTQSKIVGSQVTSRKQTRPPIIYKIVLDTDVDANTRKAQSVFIGEVVATAENSRMLGYAMHIIRSESLEEVQYTVVIDTDVSTTIEIELGTVMSTVFALAKATALTGRGLNIIRVMDGE